jgi:hypothetical protein
MIVNEAKPLDDGLHEKLTTLVPPANGLERLHVHLLREHRLDPPSPREPGQELKSALSLSVRDLHGQVCVVLPQPRKNVALESLNLPGERRHLRF